MPSAARAGNPIPQPSQGRELEYESAQALFGRAGAFEPMARAAERWQYQDQRGYKELTLGSYARVARRLKLGLFDRAESGARHDDDWIKDGPGRWSWRDTTRRTENVLILDATPRTGLGGNWVGSLKVRGEHDFFDGQSLVKVAPQLAWFWMDGLRPRATIFFRFEATFPLNYGETIVSERWWYLAALWHARPWLSLGPEVSLRDETWSTSAQYRALNPGADYKVLYRAWVPGFSLVARLP
jgi:hypothetical protein